MTPPTSSAARNRERALRLGALLGRSAACDDAEMRLVTLGFAVLTLPVAMLVACGDDSAVGTLSGGPATTGGLDPGSSGEPQTTMSPDSSGDASATQGTTST
ncbi:MAG TPA: hypothetical protein VFG69_01665, partial [Nannocystaceae bacterium]|nr:hypothetical protein [Nannocystaceae bacterium]